MTTETKGQIRVCPRCREPLVWTFEFPGAEYACICGYLCGAFGDLRYAPATLELQQRHAAITELHRMAAAERRGIPYQPPAQDIEPPVCGGCEVVAESPFDSTGKPRHWFSRTKDGVTQFACSRECIPSNETVMPW